MRSIHILGVLASSALPLAAQTCNPAPPTTLRTYDPWRASFFYGPYNQDTTINLFFDLDVQTPITVQRLRMTTYNQGAGSGSPPNQVGNLAEARIYLIPGTRTGHETTPGDWGVAPPMSGLPEVRGELTVVPFPGDSPIQNFKDGAGAPIPFLIQPGQYGVCVELIPTSWNGTALIPGQTNVPLLNPGPLHTIGFSPNLGQPWSDLFVHLDNDGIMQRGWQLADATGNLQPFATPGSVTDSINLAIDYVPGTPGGALAVPYGAGCYTDPRMVFERMPSPNAAVDLINTRWTLAYQPDGTGGRYVITPGGPAYDSATAIANGTDLLALTPTSSGNGTWRDGSLVRPLPPTLFPAGLPFPGGSCSAITINSNGKIYLGSTVDPTFATNGPSNGGTYAFQNLLPQLAPFHVDLDPTAAGALRYEDPSPGGGVRITWNGVPNEFWQSPALCDFQLELLPNGDVHFAYGPRLAHEGASNHALVGFSPGLGAPMSTPIDWSAITLLPTGSGTIAPALGLSAPPAINTVVDVVVTGLGAGASQPIGGFLSLGLASLPSGLSLSSYGLPGCEAHVDLSQVLFSVMLPNPNQTDLRWSWNVPGNANGYQVYFQAGVFGPTPHNAIGLLLTNAVCASIGQ